MDINEFISQYADDPKVVFEGYVGKTSSLIKIEEAFDELVNEVKSGLGDGQDLKDRASKIVKVNKMNLNWDKRLRAVETLFEKEFGFKKMELVVQNQIFDNAFTLVKSKFTRANTNKFPELPTKHGQKYMDTSGQYVCSVWVNSTLFANFTGGEILAIILHEVGHNFEMASKSWFAESIGKILLDEAYETKEEDAKKFDDLIDEYKWIYKRRTETQNRELSKLTLSRVMAFIRSVKFSFLSKLLDNIFTPIILPLQWLVIKRIPLYWKKVGGEVFADSFAAAYGYGPELMSSFRKLEDESVADGGANTFTGSVNYTLSIIPRLLSFVLDVHPANQARLKRQLIDLERIANDPNTPPMTKKLVQRDLEEARKIYAKYLDGSGSAIRSFMRKLQENYFKGSFDFRAYLIEINALNTPEDVQKHAKK